MLSWYNKKKVNEKDIKKYPCEECGVLRSENEGGKIFTVCNDCWEKHYERHFTVNGHICSDIDHDSTGANIFHGRKNA